jgi:YVTN family beta-propeller protein
MKQCIATIMCLAVGLCSCGRNNGAAQDTAAVGPRPRSLSGAGGNGWIVSTRQVIRPAGRSVEFHGRPVDLALAPDGRSVYVKGGSQLLVIDVESWTIRQELKYPAKGEGKAGAGGGIGGLGGGTMHGIVAAPDGSEGATRIYVTTADGVLEARASAAGAGAGAGVVKWARSIAIGGTEAERPSYPCGLALLDGNSAGDGGAGASAAVCLSMNNSLAIVDLQTGAVSREIPVGMAPFDVAISADGKLAYVSNWGGRRPRRAQHGASAEDRTAKSAGDDIVVDERGTASTGTVSVVDLAAGRQIAEIACGLHPADVELSADGASLYVANANSDTISVIDTAARAVSGTIGVRPDAALPFGSASNALAVSRDGGTLFVANGGNNAVAVVALDGSRRSGQVAGFIPAAWYPGGVITDGRRLFIANVKGVGSRDPADAGKWRTRGYWGSVSAVNIPDAAQLASDTKQVKADARVPQALAAWEKAQRPERPAPVPAHVGEPSVFDHVVYIIKENRTYDQLLGDLPRGNNDPKLCVFGRTVTPNHHALAEQFVLLDNFYCNGVLSADGHAWATQGLAVDYLEKSFGAWSRSYPFPGDDALAIAPTGFIWDNALLHGLTFRNSGEMSTTHAQPPSSWKDIYDDYVHRAKRIHFEREMNVATLRQYSCPDSPGWNLKIPDMIRADVFLKEFGEFEKSGDFPNLTIIYLPSDHTSGTSPGGPTPAAQVADNDLAMGRIVDAISHSRFWPKTCVFAIEDDPQNGFDHVDGHRSICLVASPYTKRGQVISTFYNQTSVLHTMELMLGLGPMNQMDAMAPVMKDVFTSRADRSPYICLPNNIPLDQLNPPKAAMRGLMLKLAAQSEELPLEQPDLADENTLNRIVWHAMKGPLAKYPADFAGAHGRGLGALHLKLDRGAVDADGDDD